MASTRQNRNFPINKGSDPSIKRRSEFRARKNICKAFRLGDQIAFSAKSA